MEKLNKTLLLNIFLEKIQSLQKKMNEDNIDIFFSRKDESVENTDLLDLIGFEGSTGDILMFHHKIYFIHDSRYSIFAQKIKKELGIETYCINDFVGNKDENGKIIPAYKYLYKQILKTFKTPHKSSDKDIKINISSHILASDFDYFKNIFECNLSNTHILNLPKNNKKQNFEENIQENVRKTISPVYRENTQKEPETLKSLRPQIHKALDAKLSEKNIDVLILNMSKDVIDSNIGYLFGMNAFEGIYFFTQDKIYAIPDKILTNPEKNYFESILGLEIKNSVEEIFSEITQNSPKSLDILMDGKILYHHKQLLETDLEKFQKNSGKKLNIKNSQDFVSKLQEIKYPEEIEIMRDAQHHVDEILLKKFPRMLKEGITEKELAKKLEKELKAEGNFGLSFRAIVAFGENSASPHSTPSDRKLTYNENILIDCGVTNYGYCSDLTRNFWFGEKENIEADYLEDYQKLKILQAEFTKKYYKIGIALKKIALKTSVRLKDLFGDDGVRHSLGHSLGIIEVHQSPAVSVSNDLNIKFKKGHIQTNEPGVYRDGKYGIRIEDSIAITENKADILTQLPHKLMLINKNGELSFV